MIQSPWLISPASAAAPTSECTGLLSPVMLRNCCTSAWVNVLCMAWLCLQVAIEIDADKSSDRQALAQDTRKTPVAYAKEVPGMLCVMPACAVCRRGLHLRIHLLGTPPGLATPQTPHPCLTRSVSAVPLGPTWRLCCWPLTLEIVPRQPLLALLTIARGCRMLAGFRLGWLRPKTT